MSIHATPRTRPWVHPRDAGAPVETPTPRPAPLHAALPFASLVWVTRILGYGIGILPFIAAVVPFSVGTGTQSRIVAALVVSVLLVGGWLLALVITRQATFVRTPINAPSLAMCLVWILACIASNAFLDPRIAVRLGQSFVSVQAASITVTIACVGLMVLGANIGRNPRYAEVATWSLVAVGSGMIVLFFLGRDGRFSFISTGGLFSLWVVTLAYAQGLSNERLWWPLRLGLLAIAGAYLVKSAIMQTVWLSGWMPAVAAVVVVTFLRSIPLFLVGSAAGSVGLIFWWDKIEAAVFEANVDEGSGTRIDIWLQAWDLLSQYPLLGTGPAGYASYYMTLYTGSASSMSTHSNYVDVAAQTGIVGSIVFLWLLGALAVVAFQACRRWNNSRGFEGAFVQGATGGLAGAVVAMALGDWVLPFVYNQGIGGFRYTVHTWVYLGLMAGLAAVPAVAVKRRSR